MNSAVAATDAAPYFFTIKEAALVLGVSESTYRRREGRGEVPSRRQLSPRRIGYAKGDILLCAEGNWSAKGGN